MDRIGLSRIWQDFFAEHSEYIGIDPRGMNGMSVDRRMLLLGCKVDYMVPGELWNLAHEMAHLVEIDDARCFKFNWGFSYGTKYTFPGREWYEMHTIKATAREIRTLGWQIGFNNRYGLDEYDSIYMAKLMEIIDGHTGYGDRRLLKRDSDGSYNEWRKEMLDRIEAEILNFAQDHPFEAFKAEWDRKMGVLRRNRANILRHYATYR